MQTSIFTTWRRHTCVIGKLNTHPPSLNSYWCSVVLFKVWISTRGLISLSCYMVLLQTPKKQCRCTLNYATKVSLFIIFNHSDAVLPKSLTSLRDAKKKKKKKSVRGWGKRVIKVKQEFCESKLLGQEVIKTIKIYKYRQNTTKFIILYHFWTTCFDFLESSSGPLVNWSKTI